MPPGTGIVHQVNIEYLASVVMTRDGVATPITWCKYRPHTTRFCQRPGCARWCRRGIEAEAAMLGQPVSMLSWSGLVDHEIQPGVTTDVVLTVTEMLRQHGVVGKFVEFYGEGVAEVPLANRATLGNMSPEFGSTAAIFLIDEENHQVSAVYRRTPGRSDHRGLRQGAGTHDPVLTSESGIPRPTYPTWCQSIAGPKRPGPNRAGASQINIHEQIYHVGNGLGFPPTTRTRSWTRWSRTFPASDPGSWTFANDDVATDESVHSLPRMPMAG